VELPTCTITSTQVKVQVGSSTAAYTGASQTVSLTVTPSSASSVVVLTYTSASPSYNSTTGPTHTGTYTATASLSDSSNYAFTSDSVNPGTLTINPAPVTVSITGTAIYDGNPHAATVTTSSSGVSTSVHYTGTGTAYNATAAPTNADTYTVTVTITDSNYMLSGSGSGSFSIGRAGQTLVFNPPATQIFADPDFAVSAVADSGLTASLTGNSNSICTVTDNGNGSATVHILAVGSCSITASQPGTSNISAASPVTRTITINPARVQTVLSNTNGTYPASAFGQTIALSVQVMDIDHNVALSSGYVEIKAFCRLKDEDTATGPCSPAVVLDVTPTSWNGDTSVLTPTLALNGSGVATVSIGTLPVGGPGFIKAIYHAATANLANYAIQPYDTVTIDDNKSDQAMLTAPNVYTGTWDFLNQQITQASSSVTLNCPATAQAFTGSPVTPCTASYTSSDGGAGSLTVSYTNNTNVGTASASATWAGDRKSVV